MSSYKVLPAVFLAVFLSSSLYAQIDRGSVVGTVRDASGGTIVGATVSATEKSTGVVLTSKTNGSGEYQFNALKPGAYSVKASMDGFSSQEFPDVIVEVQGRPSLEFNLQVGSVSQTLEVKEQTPLLNTETADVGGVVRERQIVDLP